MTTKKRPCKNILSHSDEKMSLIYLDHNPSNPLAMIGIRENILADVQTLKISDVLQNAQYLLTQTALFIATAWATRVCRIITFLTIVLPLLPTIYIQDFSNDYWGTSC